MIRGKQILAAVLLCLISVLAYTPNVQAVGQSSSPNYSVDEVNFGSGGELNACSTNYCSKQSAGELTVGNTKSTNYQAQAGFNTDRQQLLEVAVNGGPIDLGTLDPMTTHSGSTTFSVRTYEASGYSVVVSGTSLHTASHTLSPLASPTASQVGTEQFGINLRKNSTPNIGSDVQQVPDSSFSFGQPSANYAIADKFMYVNGDVIASSAQSSGQTVYTMSVIANVSTGTPAGIYTGSLSVIVTPTF